MSEKLVQSHSGKTIEYWKSQNGGKVERLPLPAPWKRALRLYANANRGNLTKLMDAMGYKVVSMKDLMTKTKGKSIEVDSARAAAPMLNSFIREPAFRITEEYIQANKFPV